MPSREIRFLDIESRTPSKMKSGKVSPEFSLQNQIMESHRVMLFQILSVHPPLFIQVKKPPALPQTYISASHSDTSPDALHCKTYCMVWHMFYKADTMPDKSPASISNHFSISIAICIIFSKDSLKCSSPSGVRFLGPFK